MIDVNTTDDNARQVIRPKFDPVEKVWIICIWFHRFCLSF
jgi:hypothetical protein